MVKLDEKSLENAFSRSGGSDDGDAEPAKAEMPPMPKEEEVGFHKGSLNTLAAERNELVKMIQNVEMIMQMHLKRLEELGVKIPVEKADEKK